MNNVKLSLLALAISLTGCQASKFENRANSDPLIAVGSLISNHSEINKLSPKERCEHIHIDLREDCRKKVEKEVEEMAEAMKKSR